MNAIKGTYLLLFAFLTATSLGQDPSNYALFRCHLEGEVLRVNSEVLDQKLIKRIAEAIEKAEIVKVHYMQWDNAPKCLIMMGPKGAYVINVPNVTIPGSVWTFNTDWPGTKSGGIIGSIALLKGKREPKGFGRKLSEKLAKDISVALMEKK